MYFLEGIKHFIRKIIYLCIRIPVYLYKSVHYKEFYLLKERLKSSSARNLDNYIHRGWRQYAHAWDYCTLSKGNDIPQCVGYCLLFGEKQSRASCRITFNSSHAFSF